MKKIFALTAVFALVMATAARAQDTTTPPAGAQAPAATAPAPTTGHHGKSAAADKGGRADKEMADLSARLNLTDDQKTKIQPIVADEQRQLHKAKKTNQNDADAEKAATKKIRDDANQQIRALLTPDQQKLFDASSKHSEKKGEGKGHKNAAPATAPAAPPAAN